jgi:sugar/nucleoside kinase (ribokinase family)
MPKARPRKPAPVKKTGARRRAKVALSDGRKTSTRNDAPNGARRGGRDGVIVGVGLATVDLISMAPRMEERVVELSVFSMQGGGATGNALAAAANLGAKTRYFGRLGSDDFGRFITANLKGLEVDTSLISVERGKMSPVSLVQIDELTRKRKILFTRGSTTDLVPRDLPRRLLEGATMLYIDGYQPALQAAVAEKAREKGITVLLNAGHLVGGMGELLALSDVVISSERFASELAPSDNVEQSLREILQLGPRVAVITMGDAGAMALEGNKLVQQDAIDVFVADTTGAGDIFSGAFAYATLQNWPLEKALPFANAAAGLTCRTLGAQSSLPTIVEVQKAVLDG